MIEFGKTLREAREAKGYTITQIADATRMMSSIVEGLENEDFSRIAAPIYGRGFVKLYCEAVGLDPKPLVAEFTEIYNGNREPSIRERKPLAAAAPAVQPEPVAPPRPVAEPVSAPEPPPSSGIFDLFSQPPYEPKAEEKPVQAAAPAPGPEPAPEPKPAPEPEPAAREPDPTPLHGLFSQTAQAPFASTQSELFSQASAAASDDDDGRPVISRYATPIRDYAGDLPRFAPAAFRWAVVVTLLALVLWGLAAGVRALYRATSSKEPAVDNPTPQQVVEAPAKKQAEKPKPADAKKPAKAPDSAAPASAKPRTPQEIPPLYID
ncbi:MAG: helix-turn-helix domain-containing protein [Kiritimatiellae bacterium]|nr:helix-turn-helix domain-containing protein [Kiritimatiellia bacterium]